MPKRITAFIRPQVANNVTGYEDSFTVLLHYDGMIATAKAAVISPEIEQLRYWVRGENGSYKKVDKLWIRDCCYTNVQRLSST